MKDKLQNLYDIFKFSPHGRWIVDFGDYLTLTKVISDNNIKNVLELGTGIGASTAVMALAGANVTTVEQYDKCVTIAKELIPKDLQERIKFYREDLEVFQPIPFQYFQRFKKLPVGDYDLIVIDGSGPFVDANGFLVDMPGGDFIELIGSTKKGTLFYIDGRKQMVKLMFRFFSKYFDVLENTQNVTLLRRTDYVGKHEDGAIGISDVLHSSFKEQGYL
jgi:protein-L-isoaspartate O-methyltransferase